MNIIRIDHIVLTVRDLQKTADFYTNILGCGLEEYIPGRFCLKFGDQKINLHGYDRIPDPNVKNPTPGSADFCFIVNGSIDKVLAELKTKNVPIIDGPVKRNGARFSLLSIYIYDPDQNLIELSEQID